MANWQENARREFYFKRVLESLPHHPILTKRRRTDSDNNTDDHDVDDWFDNFLAGLDSSPLPTQHGGALDSSSLPTQHGGSDTPIPLFTFSLKQTAMPRAWKNTVHKTRFAAGLHQQREAQEGDNLANELTDAIRRALLSSVQSQNLQLQDTLHFTLQADAFSSSANHCFQSASFTVTEIESSSQRFDTYLHKLSQQLNSSQSFSKGENFTMDITTIKAAGPGTGRKKYDPVGCKVRNIVKRSRIVITNSDELCCARALVTMKAYVDERNNIQTYISYNALRRGKTGQTQSAKRLHAVAGVPEGPCGYVELTAFQRVLTGYQIKVLSLGPPHMITFRGESNSPNYLLLILDNGHYDGCTSFAAFLNRSYFCHECDRGYDHDDINHHPCTARFCTACLRKDCGDFTQLKSTLLRGEYPKPTIPCQLCHRLFFGQACLRLHSLLEGHYAGKSTCQTHKRCPKCFKSYKVEFTSHGNPKGPRHKCDHAICDTCDKYVNISLHKCYIQCLDPSEDAPKTRNVALDDVEDHHTVVSVNDSVAQVAKPPPLFVYADYESISDENGVQTAILLGYETNESEECHLIYGEECTDVFFEALEDLATDEDGIDRPVIVLFHNLKGFDGMFLLEYCYKNHREVANAVYVGAKIYSFTSDRLTFKDSLCFLPFPLAAFPATFGLTELCKGYFPHKFNTLANQEYEGPLPDAVYYDPDGMSPSKRDDFARWHADLQARNYVFNLQRDMKTYCESDVKLLKAGCEAFVVDFKKEADFNPLEKCITIASACNRYWRKKHLKASTVAVQPPRGWMGAQTNQSYAARQWLTWMNDVVQRQGGGAGDRIRHRFNGGEVRALNKLVDGYDTTTNTVYEFMGCYFHGCPRCFPSQRNSTTRVHKEKSMQDSYDGAQAKVTSLRDGGYTVVVKWECDWARERVENPMIECFLSRQSFLPPLNPRDAFFGGRTNAVKLHHHVEEGETIQYQDVTSLYPWVNKYGKYPIRHPTVYTNIHHTQIGSYFGLAKVTILPPYNLYHPVLPFRFMNKLTFPLCRTCIEVEMPKPMLERSHRCSHSEGQRALMGTWCTPELVMAVDHGYRILSIHEVWHFPPANQKQGLFTEYVNTWLKTKTESSGYPRWADTLEQRQRYVADYRTHEGIVLNPDLITPNAGRKACAKLMLNSFWGKFGENTRKPKTVVVRDPAALYEILSNPTTPITSLRVCSEECLEVVYTANEDEYVDNGKVNIFIAAFTTCYARIKLYSFLAKLKEQVLYFDTDSVIYTHRTGQPKLDNGDHLGDLTNELKGDDYIKDFTSAGPKNYGYITHQGKTECKVRGFTLSDIRGARQLNYNILRQNVLDELTRPLPSQRTVDVVNPRFFTRDPTTKELRVISRTKVYTMVFDKRVVDPASFQSFPYGYSRNPLGIPVTPRSGWSEERPACACALFDGEGGPCLCDT